MIRINARNGTGPTSTPVTTKNGRWFAVFASGPTGPVSVFRSLGRSDQTLKLFVVDLAASGTLVENTNYWVLDTGIKNAFAGSMSNAPIDADRWNRSSGGFYQDDALYIGYVKGTSDDTPPPVGTTWTGGGVLRVIIPDNFDPTTAPSTTSWSISSRPPNAMALTCSESLTRSTTFATWNMP